MKPDRYEIVYPEEMPSGVILEKNVYAEMRDGVKLALDIYRPAQGDGPWPVIVGYAGFPKEHFFESALPDFYCPNGYVCVQVQARGSCLSEGKYRMHAKEEAQDGYDVIEWIARQPWCSGNVGMMGASYFGVNQWITAILNPPHLKCIVPCPGTTDNYRGLFYPGGVFSSGFAMFLVSMIVQGAIWPGLIPGKELPEDILTNLFYHTEDSQFYEEHGTTCNRIDRIKVPVLSICPAANELHTMSHLKSHLDIRPPKKLLITPWNGTWYQPFIFQTISLNQQILRWFDYWLKGIDTGIMDEPDVAIYDNGTGQWRYENEYPLARTQWWKFYLHGKSATTEPWGAISETPPVEMEQPHTYRYPGPQLQPQKTQFLGYVTPPLQEDLAVRGPVSITFYAATTEEILSDWSFFVKVGEMVPDGVLINPVTGEPQIKPEWTSPWTPREVQLWSWGNLKAKFREVDESRSKPGQPYHTFRNPADLESNTVYEFQLELQPVFNTFKKGHRIWVQIASDDPAYSTWDSSSQYVGNAVRNAPPFRNEVSVYHDSKYPSHLLLPVIPAAPEIVAVKSPLRDAVPGAPKFR